MSELLLAAMTHHFQSEFKFEFFGKKRKRKNASNLVCISVNKNAEKIEEFLIFTKFGILSILFS